MEGLNRILNTVVLSLGDTKLTVGGIVLASLLIVLGFFLARWLEKRLTSRLVERKVKAEVVHLIRRIFYIIVVVILVITALGLLNVPLAAFAFISGALAIGVGFGAQNIINNFISGWILMWERPIRIGDWVEIGEDIGVVEEINTRSTRLKRIDGVHLLLPNSKLLEDTVINWTRVDNILRSVVRVGVSYSSDVVVVKSLLDKIVRAHEGILTKPEPQVIFEDFGDSSLVFDVYFWIEMSEGRSLRGTRSELRFKIAEIFEENGVIIAFPQQDVHIDGSIEIARDQNHHTMG
jgi:small-conductance mechanosensitive channel